jgi:anti-anti-sigma factor
LSGIEEYAPIVKLLNDLADREPEKIILNLQKLEFLNSSGINVLSKYAIKVRQKGMIQMVVKGSKSIPWQAKSLKNLQRLMPSLQLELQ